MLLKVRVLTGENRLPQHRRDVVVTNHDAPLDSELIDDLPVACEQAGDRVGLIGVEGADLGQIVGVGEEDAAECPEQRHDHEEGDEARLPGDPNDNPPPGGRAACRGDAHASVASGMLMFCSLSCRLRVFKSV